MDMRSLVLCLSSAILASSSFFYGSKFIRKRNYLLGIEMWVVGVSATNAIIFFSTGSAISYEIAHFFDSFSRGFGIPIIAVAGLMTITHGYKPSARQDVLFFVLSTAGTFVLVTAHFVEALLPYYYVVMWTLLSIYLAYIIKRLMSIGAVVQAFAVLLALISSGSIACIYDFYKIPGEETNVVFNFFVLALNAWAYFMPAIYYAYCALERKQNEGIVLNRPVACRH
ncbi:hypothetical protein LGM89_26795 [Burkholderia sp. AU31624]|uniref:hypothetical protein n=1 Tax=Burkholderia sp. AU31624 TaxID=2879629 RepID=UPI001CF18DDC|nr:hypothetical protein [Burkholderia sp. AU31624]MCA8256890.1 hypothetical protein [Burkholderia sp. AU31624]